MFCLELEGKKKESAGFRRSYKWELASAILLVRKIKYRNLEEPNTLEEPTT